MNTALQSSSMMPASIIPILTLDGAQRGVQIGMNTALDAPQDTPIRATKDQQEGYFNALRINDMLDGGFLMEGGQKTSHVLRVVRLASIKQDFIKLTVSIGEGLGDEYALARKGLQNTSGELELFKKIGNTYKEKVNFQLRIQPRKSK